LTKDGWFLVDNIPYNELVTTSYRINEGLPAHIIDRMSRSVPDPQKITLLGMTFKRDSDDLRNSVSISMRKHLRRRGFSNIVEIEPNVEGFDEWGKMKGSDWVILMTPHSAFDELEKIVNSVRNDECLYCDIWGHWNSTAYTSDNGYFFGHEAETQDIREDLSG